MCIPKSKGGLGFPKFEWFNQALLAKQGWRILTNPSSSFTQFFKGKYFPSSSYFQAKQGSRPSWGWQSFIWGRKILQYGTHLQIGNGEAIFGKEDKWISKSFPRKPTVKASHDPSIVRLAQLINAFSNNWDMDVLTRNFHEEEV